MTVLLSTQSLTEDYDIGFRLKETGMTEIFVRFPVVDEAKEREQRANFTACADVKHDLRARIFPDTFSTAVRQNLAGSSALFSRALKPTNGPPSLTLNHFLWRDRKGAISNFVRLPRDAGDDPALLLLAYESLWRLMPGISFSIFSGSAWLMTLLWLNFGLMINRIVQRVIFVTGYYGRTQGLLSVLRLFWGNPD